MKPRKPNISKPHLKWAFSKRKNVWEPYHRVTWTEGGKQKERSILLTWGGDREKLDHLYWQCESGRHEKQKPKPTKYTWRRLIEEWRTDPRIQKRLAASTKVSYRRDMDRILEKNGEKDVRRTTRQGLRMAHDNLAATPRKADKYLTTVSLLWNFAVKKRDWPLGKNPAEGIDRFGKQREFLPWPDWMVKKLSDAPQTVRSAAELILNTGQRPNAAIAMRHDHFHGEWMEVLDEKGAQQFEIYCPPEFREYLSHLPKKGAYVLAKNLTEPLGYDAVEKQFRNWRAGLGDAAKQYSLHGLRKLSIIRLAEAGCSDAQIQAVTNQSPEMISYYRKQASRKALSRSAMERKK